MCFLVGVAVEARVATVLCAFAALATFARTSAQARRVVAIAAIAIAAGAIDCDLVSRPLPAIGDAHVRRSNVVVVDAAVRSDGGASLMVRMTDGAQALLETPAVMPIGERLYVRAKREPFDEPRNPGEPSERELEAEHGVTWRLVEATVLGRAPPDDGDIALWLPRARAWASTQLHAMLPEPDATILAGAMWGERGALPPQLRADFQDTGTVHVLVTAGLHLGVVAALALALLRALGTDRIGAVLVTIAIVWTYAAFSGDHLPSIRAAAMLTFALLAYAAGREALSWNALGAAAIAIAALHPRAVTSASFALSFSCVAAILAFARSLTTAIEGRGVPRLASELAAVAIAAQLGTWPLVAATFLVIAPYGVLANFAAVPVVGVAMLGGFATLLATPVPIVAHGAANVTQSLVDWIVACVAAIGTLPGAAIVATPPPPWTIVAYDASLALCAIAVARRRHIAAAIAGVAFASALCLWPPRVPDRDLTITAIDVGQADALLVRTPAGHAFLVDGGGRLERGASLSASTSEAIGERVVVPYLVRSGIHHLDAVLLSHPHGDHAGGLPAVLRTLGASAFADSGQTYPGHAYHDALAVARSRNIPLLEPRGGDVWHTDDGVTFRFYGPTLPYITRSRSDINSNSLVFRLEYGRTRMLFMGDAGTETEQRLLVSGDDLRADVLKVGHHGSAYGTTPAFARAVGARIAVISVGRHNLFGHPAPSTIATLEARGVRVYRTDRDGAIVIRSDGKSVRAVPFLTSDHNP